MIIKEIKNIANNKTNDNRNDREDIGERECEGVSDCGTVSRRKRQTGYSIASESACVRAENTCKWLGEQLKLGMAPKSGLLNSKASKLLTPTTQTH